MGPRNLWGKFVCQLQWISVFLHSGTVDARVRKEPYLQPQQLPHTPPRGCVVLAGRHLRNVVLVSSHIAGPFV